MLNSNVNLFNLDLNMNDTDLTVLLLNMDILDNDMDLHTRGLLIDEEFICRKGRYTHTS